MFKINYINSNNAVELLKNNKKDIIANNDYLIDNKIIDGGWLCDDTGIYVPYKHKNEKYYDPRNIYLKISRQITEEPTLNYTFGKLEDNLFYPMESCSSPALISDTDKKLNRNISHAGRRCNLNSRTGVYKNFMTNIKDDINESSYLDILKNDNYDLSKKDVLNTFTVDSTFNNHNVMDMRELFKLALGAEPTYSYPKKGYDMFICPFHDDHKPSARVFQHVFQCFKHTQMQFDQTEFLKWLFYLKTTQEIENKFQELQQ